MRELLATVDSAELTEWMAFAELEPFGGPADDYRAGLPAAAVVNVHRDGGQPVQPLDFIPWAPRPEPQALDDDALVDAFDRLVGLD